MKENRYFPLVKAMPNFLTLLGLCAGLTSIKFTFQYNWEMAVVAIMISAIADGMDGRLARILNTTSEFGAQLDSLADFLNFGIAPALLLYFWSFREIKVFGWTLVMIYVICIAIRLARFNLPIDEDEPDWKQFFFSGMPSPAAAILSLLPLILTLLYQEEALDFRITTNQSMLYVFLISVATVSRVPTFSIKKMAISRNNYAFLLFGIGMVMISLLTKPWVATPILSILYLLSIPCSATYYWWLRGKK